MALPSCVHCIHYFITYEPACPYGCRAMGFKSRHNPAQVVFRSSGVSCRMFQKKQVKKETVLPHSGKNGIIA